MNCFYSITFACFILIKRVLFIYVFIWGFTLLATHCIGLIMMGSFMGSGNQYKQLVKVLYCKLSTNSRELPAFPLDVGPGLELLEVGGESVTTLQPCPPPPPPKRDLTITFIPVNMFEFCKRLKGNVWHRLNIILMKPIYRIEGYQNILCRIL